MFFMLQKEDKVLNRSSCLLPAPPTCFLFSTPVGPSAISGECCHVKVGSLSNGHQTGPWPWSRQHAPHPPHSTAAGRPPPAPGHRGVRSAAGPPSQSACLTPCKSLSGRGRECQLRTDRLDLPPAPYRLGKPGIYTLN